MRNIASGGSPEASKYQADILLISGLHANEECAPLMARKVYQTLRKNGARVVLFEIPYSFTLLALIDDPQRAVRTYSAPPGQHSLDMDLDGLDVILRVQHPISVVFEFHNSEDWQAMLGIDPAKPTCDYEVGIVGPQSGPAHEIALWRNIAPNGLPGKYLVELPACYRPVEPAARRWRAQRLARLAAEGRIFDPRWSHYLESVTDEVETRQRGYLDECLAEKLANWIQAHVPDSSGNVDLLR